MHAMSCIDFVVKNYFCFEMIRGLTVALLGRLMPVMKLGVCQCRYHDKKAVTNSSSESVDGDQDDANGNDQSEEYSIPEVQMASADTCHIHKEVDMT